MSFFRRVLLADHRHVSITSGEKFFLFLHDDCVSFFLRERETAAAIRWRARKSARQKKKEKERERAR